MTAQPDEKRPSSGYGIGRWIPWGFAAVGAYFLFTEHREHLFQYLPYALLLACPLMHLFHGHGGHGGHGAHGDRQERDADAGGGRP